MENIPGATEMINKILEKVFAEYDNKELCIKIWKDFVEGRSTHETFRFICKNGN